MPFSFRSVSLVLASAYLAFSCATSPCDLQGPQTNLAQPYTDVEVHEVKDGLFDSYRSTVYMPAKASAAPLPVVLFLHGYFDADPEPYDAFLRFLARKGYVVVYPTYGNFLSPKSWVTNAETAMQRALEYLKHNRPVDRDRVAFIGHSIGGILALHLAQKEVKDQKIPLPKLIATTEAAGIVSPAYPYMKIDQLDAIPKDTRLLLLIGEESYREGLKKKDACFAAQGELPKECNVLSPNRLAFKQSSQIPKAQKSAVLIPSLGQGEQRQHSDHNAMQAYCGWFRSKPLNSIDTEGYWAVIAQSLDETLGGERLLQKQRKAESRVALDSCLDEGRCPENF